jgi:ribosomal protein S18 acetylase RimI-like enzyme
VKAGPDAGDEVLLRPLLASDRAALRTATLANMNWSGDERFTDRDIDEKRELRHYVDLQPDRGDFGFVAERAGAVVGIVWLLFLPADDPGYGFIGEGVPELSVSVWPGCRGKGIGERLMRQALADARGRGIVRVSLSVEPRNPSLHLYRKLGFMPVKGASDGTHALAL